MAQLPTRSLRLRSYATQDLDRLTGDKGEIFYDYELKTLKVYNGAGVTASTVNVGAADRLVNGSRSVILAANGALTISGDIRSDSDINIEINLADSTLQRWSFGEDGSLTFPDGTTQTTAWLGAGPVFTSLIDSLDSSAITITPSAIFSSNVTIENDLVAKNIVNGGQIWTFGTNGTLTAPGTVNAPNIFTNLIDSADSSAITVTPSAIFSSDVTVENDLLVKNITLMTVGGGSTIKEGLAPNLAGGAIILTPAFGANDNQALVIYPTAGEGNHIHLTANGGTTELYLGDDTHYVKLGKGAGYNGTIVIAATGQPDTVTGIISSAGNWAVVSLSNLATTGGTGTGLTVTVTQVAGVATAIAIVSAQMEGYTSGDTVTVTSGAATATFIIGVLAPQWVFAPDGDLYIPSGNTIRKIGGGEDIRSIPGPYADDEAAALAGVALGYPYHKTGTGGQVFVRLTSPT